MSVAVIGFLGVGALILGWSIWSGVTTFTPERAQNIRRAEAEALERVEQVRQLRIIHPEMCRHDRLDRHPAYVLVIVALLVFGWNVLFGDTAGSSNLAQLPPDTQRALAVCLLVGTILALLSAAGGVKVGRWVIGRPVREHLWSDRLGDDIRVPYIIGCLGLASTFFSMVFYVAWTPRDRILGTLGGVFSVAAVGICLALGVMLSVGIRRFVADRDVLVAEYLAERERPDDAE